MNRSWLARAIIRCKWLWLLLLPMICLSIVILVMLNSKASLTAATWIWNAKLIASQSEEILTFAKKNEINLLYLHIEPVAVSPQAYKNFIKKATDQGIKVEALGGDPNWALSEKRESIGDLIAWVKAYNNTAKKEERFSGIHVDIEPYLLPEWKTDQASIVEQWLSNVEYLVAETKKDTQLTVSADLPFWINTVPVPEDDEKKVSEWMLERLDSITLMAYRNHAKGANGIIDIVQAIVDDADAAKKSSVIVGVNILESTEGDNVSFHANGTAEMKTELAILQEELSQYPAFGGSAIHDYESWHHASKREEKLDP